MTSRLTQDCLERLFGIIRQSNAANYHPPSFKFLIIVNCSSFYNIAKSSRGTSRSAGVLNVLFNTGNIQSAKSRLHNCVEAGRLEDIVEAPRHHGSCHQATATSNSYATSRDAQHPSSSTRNVERGGLICVTDALYKLIGQRKRYLHIIIQKGKIASPIR